MGPSEYKAGVLTTLPLRSVTLIIKILTSRLIKLAHRLSQQEIACSWYSYNTNVIFQLIMYSHDTKRGEVLFPV
jgi:hypothetical protein